ncbi:MAG: AAA family ATPase [Treponema sp.]|nr:AAA family ATPase [Treponema sp.]MCL2251140.1 AAA family ATPase [Treponema sp.]
MKNEYFKRNIDAVLAFWVQEEGRKPLLLRGARQVGKTSAVRALGKKFKFYVEINFDDDKEACEFFKMNLDPAQICSRLSVYVQTPIIPGETLIFFDEVQSCVDVIKSLRYFYEKYPAQHIIAAGSLLEFALDEIPSFGVGRLHSEFMYPFSFYEFLEASGEEMLSDACKNADPENPLPEPIHKKLIDRFKVFLLVGGMPEAVAGFLQTKNLLDSQKIIEDIINTFRDDFSKYRKRMPSLILNEVFESVMYQVQGKFIYEHAAVETGNARVKQALEMLIMAGLAIPVTHSAANGIPIGAEINPKYRRIIPCDTGIFLHILGIDVSKILLTEDFKTINQGALAEIFAGLELLKSGRTHAQRQLYCWSREKAQSSAQIDYLIQRGTSIIPIEVKSGTQGGMKSLDIFMKEKNITHGIRTSLENFAKKEKFDIIPLYAISNLYNNEI